VLSRRSAGVTVAVLVALAVQVGCGGDGADQATGRTTTTTTAPRNTAPTTTTTSATAAAGPCGLAGASDITFPAGRGDATLHGVLGGSGPTTVVLAHETGQDACDWAFFVPELAGGGRQVLAFDFSDGGTSSYIGDGRNDLDVLAAVAEARRRGAARVVVIGASKGATAAVAAAGAPGGGIDGVVSLSAAMSHRNTDAGAAAAGISVPVLFVASDGDGSTAGTAQTLAQACGCAYPDVLVFGGSRHGMRLLADGGPDGAALRSALEQLMAQATQ
jgi:alpha-beta hydrolase superfamily lysophospholipase